MTPAAERSTQMSKFRSPGVTTPAPEFEKLIMAQVSFGLFFGSSAIAAGAMPGLVGAYINQFNIIVMAFLYLAIIKCPKRCTYRSTATIAVGLGLMWGYLSLQERLVGPRVIPEEHHMAQVVAALVIIYVLAEASAWGVRRLMWDGFTFLGR